MHTSLHTLRSTERSAQRLYLLTRLQRGLHYWRRVRWPGAGAPYRASDDATRAPSADYDADPNVVRECDDAAYPASRSDAPCDDAHSNVCEDVCDSTRNTTEASAGKAVPPVPDDDVQDLLRRLREMHAQADLVEGALRRREDVRDTAEAAAALKARIQDVLNDVQKLRGSS